MSNLSKALGGPRLFVKRDDSTGLGFGGNKVRKLEFLMGEALEKKADTVITTGGLQSNHARQTAAAAKRLNLKPILVLRGEQPKLYKGNLLLDALLGAELRFVRASNSEEADRIAYEIASRIEKSGGIPYVIPTGGSIPTGCLGYVAAALEIVNQIEHKGIEINYAVVANGSSGTQTGLTLGFKALHSRIEVIGISVSHSKEELKDQILKLGTRTAEKLGIDIELSEEDVVAYDEYIGPGYTVPTRECIEAIKLLARTEGLFLDPIYTGKAMAGLIDLVEKGIFKKGHNVLFMHTGGTPALFATEEVFQDV
jgi:D-cysteine desulfhydrase family pyridoxal phosphate-dependent enzyme